MKYAVVDTNVLVVANGRAPQVDEQCRVGAEKALQDIRARRSLVLDDAWRILGEYRRNVRETDQPLVGHRFFVWTTRSSQTVTITCHPVRGFVEFPSDPRLEHFDRDDRKFVAATIVSGVGETDLVNAVDSDYSQHGVALSEAGVVVRELCVEHLPTSARRRLE